MPFETVVVDGETRHRFIVNAVRIPFAERDAARRVMPDPAAATVRRYQEGLGGDAADEDPQFPVSGLAALAAAREARDAGEEEPYRRLDGSRVWYTLLLTELEAAELRGASNVIAVTVDPRVERTVSRSIRVEVTPQ